MPATLLSTAYAERTTAVTAAGKAGARGVAFLALADDEQDNALEDTAREIDSLDFAGIPESSGQAMQFPRIGARSDALARLATANMERAFERAASYKTVAPVTETTSRDVRGSVVEDTVGPLTKKYAPVAGVISSGVLARFGDRVRDALQPLLASAVPARNYGQGRVVRS